MLEIEASAIYSVIGWLGTAIVGLFGAMLFAFKQIARSERECRKRMRDLVDRVLVLEALTCQREKCKDRVIYNGTLHNR